MGQLDNQLGKIGFEHLNTPGSECCVELDLVGGKRLDLDDLTRSMVSYDLRHNGIGFPCIAGPVDMSSSLLHCGFKLQQVGIEMTHNAFFDGPPGLAELLPVGHLADHLPAFGANGVRGFVQVTAQLAVAQGLPGS